MTDEASKLLRELVEAQTAAEEDVRQWNEKLKRDQHATLFAPSESGMRLSAAWYDAIAYVNKTVAALPAAAPPKGKFDEPCPHFPDRPCYPPLCADGCKDARFIAYSKPATTDQGASVIAPKPTAADAGAQGQSTMQESNVTGNQAMSEQNAEAKGLSRAGTHAADRIECAAVRHDASGLIFSLPRPARHHDILHKMFGLGLSTTREVTTQGFLMTDGEFTCRGAARAIAKCAGQLLPRAMPTYQLFSEDVW